MKRENPYLPQALDAILSEWHRWAQGEQFGSGYGYSPMFQRAGSGRSGAESEDEVNDATIRRSTMQAVNFHIFELGNVQWITAIQMQARNLATGKQVWASPRLPQDIAARAVLLADARNALMARLMNDGVI